MGAATQKQVLNAFKDRMVEDLVENNVLRGAWIEQIVHHYLTGWDFSRPWDYFDLVRSGTRTATLGKTMSIKHSTGAKAKFEIRRKQFAWDSRLASAGQHEGWRGHEDREAQHWCDVYVFAWLPGEPTRDQILDPTAWRFHVLSRGDMYLDLPNPDGKTISETALTTTFGEPIAGDELDAAVATKAAQKRQRAEPKLDLRALELGA